MWRGSGGLNITGDIAASTGNNGTLGVGIGGFGGSGGAAGTVTLTRVGDTFTSGALSDGVTAESIGGGGGTGAINVTGNINGTTNSTSAGIALGVGGFGGGGGASGAVSLSVTGNVVAMGLATVVTIPILTPILPNTIFLIPTGSKGVVAESIGGGGGDGGLNVSGQLSLANPTKGSSIAASLGIGGFGGSGGDAGAVTLSVTPPGSSAVDVVAQGDDNSAVTAQSIGGGGGDGAINVSGGLAMGGTLAVGVGGFGGSGGKGRDVQATVDANLQATGMDANGVLAQSIGGGGGDGGINISGAITAATQTKAPSIALGLGGFGGTGNAAGGVTVVQSGEITVAGQNSYGVLAQSVGGGGGNGGVNITGDVTFTKQEQGFGIAGGVGGSGGAGANGSTVDVTSAGDVQVNAVGTTVKGKTTYANEPYLDSNAGGLVAQSIGGGGGNGGWNITGAIAPFGNPISVGVGGFGADAGNGGSVTVNRGFTSTASGLAVDPGQILAFGDGTPGLLAQSIGGGGGKAGMNLTIAAAVKTAGDNPVAGIIDIGGGAGDGGNGGAVNVGQNGNVWTSGSGSAGLVASSIGGGGGNANYNIGFGVERGENGLNLSVGGGPGAAGNGSTVAVDQTGAIATDGTASYGLLAQSIGGGGGNTAMSMAMGLAAKNSVTINVGREGGTGGTGGKVSVSQSGDVSTGGDMSSAIAAESIGGGGGTSGAVTVGVNAQSGTQDKKDSYSGSVSVGLQGGAGATGGDVNVTSSGMLDTQGLQSQGILAQSIGGGGGVGGSAANTLFNNAGGATVAVGGSGGTGATAGAVTVDTASTIQTTGDQSEGVLAQSIGGGGGEGGSTRTLNLEIGLPKLGGTNSTENTLAVNVGGSGGTGGDAGAVKVTNTGVINTSGYSSYGVRAQSIGGGGGTGGAVLNLRLQANDTNDSNSMSLNVGGSGGTGGTGAAVGVVNNGYIATGGTDAAGVVAQSVGGGGGDAGLVLDISGGAPTTKATTHSFLMDIGGSGGTGGAGGNVTVTNQGTGGALTGHIVTTGQNAYGIIGQSIGGGGGNGSSIIQVTALYTGKNSATAGIALGGSGGSGNTGGDVTVTNDGMIQTGGSGAHGLVAQSVGGGGGNGGMSIAANLTFNATSKTPLVSVGGSGGAGADGGTVLVNNSGSILTSGANANGILAQSIGGGGGNANMGFSLTGEVNSLVASNALSALMGAVNGGTGGTGGSVTVNQSGDITVLGQGSQAIVAQSINGGGGTLSLDFSGITGLPGVPYVSSGKTVTPMPSITADVGGSGGSNMNASAVTVNATGNYGAGGNDGSAGLLQSIGGGGGTLDLQAALVGQSNDPNVTGTPTAIPIRVALGGTSGSNNAGGLLTGRYTGALTTTGTDSPAQLAQSVGGGGGRAVIDLSAAQGADPGPITVVLGGSNGQDEAGGAIQFAQAGPMTTAGALSPGAMLQSVGGGGGMTAISLKSASASTAALTETLGSTGGTGLSGGAIAATFAGGIATSGDDAVGLFAQSVGGGGGAIEMSGISAQGVALGGASQASGNGGGIDITSSGAIQTSGAGSHGVFLQSIGGGGGAVFGDPAAVTLNASNSGDGGAIAFTQTGSIIVTGTGADGIIAQSIGGGGGWIDGLFSGTAGGAGTGGTIMLNTQADIAALGTDATAIFAQSEGGAGGSDIAVTIAPGTAVIGGSGGHAVTMAGGLHNELANAGTLVSAPLMDFAQQNPIVGETAARTAALDGGIDQVVITGGSGDTGIVNTGWIYGNVNLGFEGAFGTANAFENRAGAYFAPGTAVLLGPGGGAGNTLSNSGTVSPGDFYNVAVTSVAGNFSQGSGGTYLADLDLNANATDVIDVSGSAVLGGTVRLSLDNPGLAKPGSYQPTILDSAGLGGTRFGTLASPASAVFTPSLIYPNAGKAALYYTVQYAPVGLTPNESAVGAAVDGIQTAGVSAFRGIAAQLFFTPTVRLLGKTYDSLSGEGVSGFQQAEFFSRSQFFDAAMNNGSYALGAGWGRFAVASNGEARPVATARRWRFWFSGFGGNGYLGGSSSAGTRKNDYGSAGTAFGFEYQPHADAVFGGALGIEHAYFSVPGRDTAGHGRGVNVAGYGMVRFDRGMYLSGLVSYGHYRNDESRYNVGTGLDATQPWTYINQPLTTVSTDSATGRFRTNMLGGELEGGWKRVLRYGNLTPYASLRIDNQWVSSFSESAVIAGTTVPGTLGLNYASKSVLSLPLSLGLQADTRFRVDDGRMSIVPAARLAWVHEFAAERPTTQHFQIAPGFNFNTDGAYAMRDALQLDAGVSVSLGERLAIYGSFTGVFSRGGRSMGGMAGFRLSF